MLPDRVSNPGPLTYESGALPIALRGPAPDRVMESLKGFQFLLSHTSDWSIRSAFFHRLFFRELQMPWSYGRTHTVKKKSVDFTVKYLATSC